jgi:TolA-binding protein
MKRIFLLFFAAILFSSCGSRDSSYMDEAAAAMKAGKASDAAVLYQKVLSEYPEGSRAAEAQYLLAGLAQLQENQPLKAAIGYEGIVDKFPKSEYAHKGLFQAAFIYEEVLKNTEKARTLYEKYIKMYPDSSLAVSARSSLENLGKSADETLQTLLNERAGKDSAQVAAGH